MSSAAAVTSLVNSGDENGSFLVWYNDVSSNQLASNTLSWDVQPSVPKDPPEENHDEAKPETSTVTAPPGFVVPASALTAIVYKETVRYEQTLPER